jgi:hypothetical protein
LASKSSMSCLRSALMGHESDTRRYSGGTRFAQAR